MTKSKLVREFFVEDQSFRHVSEVAEELEERDVDVTLVPPEDRGISTHLVVDPSDSEKTKETLSDLGIEPNGREAVLLKLDNKPGMMAKVARQLSDADINLTYAFAAPLESDKSYVLLTSSDNEKSVEVLKN